ncbi:MAG: ATP-binding protein, partial [Alphaproteobacteria bacterium]|nr:ATP-binding protein [Alphaproteobacteria bacterium]
MKLVVENFGPIRKAEVALGPMTVFVGPSNAGKSYLAILIYSILSAAHDPGYGHAISDTYPTGLNEGSDSAEEKARVDREFLLRRIETSFMAWAKRFSRIWDRHMDGFFPDAEMPLRIQQSQKIKVSDDQGQLVLDLRVSDKSKLSAMQQQLILEKIQDSPEVRQFYGRDAADPPSKTFTEFLTPVLNGVLLGSPVVEAVPGSPQLPVHYLPATRSFIMQNLLATMQNVLAASRVARGNPLYPRHISEFLEKLLVLAKATKYRVSMQGSVTEESRRQKQKEEIAKISAFVEEKIMAGKLRVVSPTAETPEFYYEFAEDGAMPARVSLNMASSMVSELAAIVAFIRKYTYPNDLLIIEEPETGLHPGAQRDIANVLVQLANAGVRVLITTHS